MIDTSVVITIAAIIAIKLIYGQYIESTRDVSEVYLTQQSVYEGTRMAGESAVYKSNKLDYTNGLRVGLQIRYDHYKLRNGNLCDVWELFINGLKEEREKSITIHGTRHSVAALNFRVQAVGEGLRGAGVRGVAMRFDRFMRDEDVFVVVMACFISQISVHFYDKVDSADRSVLFVVGEDEVAEVDRAGVSYAKLGDENSDIGKWMAEEGTSYVFENEYHFSKDRGTAVVLSREENSKVKSSVDFSQINIVSGVASTMKHLPMGHELSKRDRLLIVEQHDNNEEFLNALIKLLTGMVSQSEIIWSEQTSWDVISSFNPTVLALSETVLVSMAPLEMLKSKLNFIEKIRLKHKMKMLSKGKFSRSYTQSALRLIYVNKSIATEMKLSTYEINEYRSLLNSRMVLEFSYYNVAGPIIHTDFFDYRVLPSIKLNALGCLSQSLEIKLTNFDNKSGAVTLRGFIIGKTNKKIVGIDETHKNISNEAMKQNKGFMQLTVNARWGNDGCLYI